MAEYSTQIFGDTLPNTPVKRKEGRAFPFKANECARKMLSNNHDLRECLAKLLIFSSVWDQNLPKHLSWDSQIARFCFGWWTNVE